MKNFKHLLAFAVLALITLSGYSQGQWRTSTELAPPSNLFHGSLNDVQFPSSTVGWAVGENGAILKSVDGGENWSSQNSGVNTPLNCLSAPSELVAYTAGDDGDFLKTSNGGEDWTHIEIPSIDNILSVDFLNDSTGWIAGFPGDTIGLTTDGGATWTYVATGSPFHLEAIHFVDESLGFAVGGFGSLLKTTDGGLSWTYFDLVTPNTFNDVFFIDANIGWIVGNNGDVRRTVDGGGTWADINIGTFESLNSIYFKNINDGWIAGNLGYTAATTDGLNFSATVSNTTEDLNSVHFPTTTTGFIAGNNGLLSKSTIGGVLYSPKLSQGHSFLSINNVDFVTAKKGWAVGTDGTVVLKTGDGGRSWVDFATSNLNTLHDVDFVDETTGWAVGLSGTIIHSTDGGENWSPQTSGTTRTLYQVQFLNSTTGYACGMDGEIRQTTNGGVNWVPGTYFGTKDLYGMDFMSADTGWVVGSNGFILRTENGGGSWTTLPSGSSQLLTDIEFRPTQVGLAVGFFGTILRSEDFGESWGRVIWGGTEHLRSVQFANDTLVWAVGDNGTFIESIDAGQTWAVLSRPISEQYSNIHFAEENTGWAFAENGAQWFYNNNESPVITADGTNALTNFDVCLIAGDTTRIDFQIADEEGDRVAISSLESWNPSIISNSGLSFSPSGYQDTPVLNGILEVYPDQAVEGTATIALRANDSISQSLSTFEISFNPATSISSNPINDTVCPGGDAQFSVSTTGTGTLSYQWQENGSGSFQNIANSDNDTLFLPNQLEEAYGTQFRCIVASDCSVDTSATAELYFFPDSKVTQHPTDSSQCEGLNASFTTIGIGGQTPMYQWQDDASGDFTDIAGATFSVLNLTAIDADMDGRNYRCIVSSMCGLNDTSDVAQLSVNKSTAITETLVLDKLCENSDLFLGSNVEGTEPFTYQWQEFYGGNWQNLNSETNWFLEIPSVDQTDHGRKFRYIASSACGSDKTSNDVTTYVYNDVTFAFQGNQLIMEEGTGSTDTAWVTLKYFPNGAIKIPPYVVDITTSNGTALLNEDFFFTDSVLTTDPDQSLDYRIGIPINPDIDIELDENFQIFAKISCGGPIVEDSIEVILENDDQTSLDFEGTGAFVSEVDAPLVLAIPVQTGIPGFGTVDVAISLASTASNVDDFVIQNSTLNFVMDANETHDTLFVEVLDDALPEDPELIILRLTNPSENFYLGENIQYEILIGDNDGVLEQNILRAKESGAVSAFRAEISSVNFSASTGKMLTRISDESGHVFASLDPDPNFNVGDEIGVSGSMTVLQGLPVFKIDHVLLAEGDSITYDNTKTTTSAAFTTDQIGDRITFDCTLLNNRSNWGKVTNYSNLHGSYHEFSFTDGTTTWTARADDNSPIFTEPTPSSVFYLTGLVAKDASSGLVLWAEAVEQGADARWTGSAVDIYGNWTFDALVDGQTYEWEMDDTTYYTSHVDHRFLEQDNYTITLTASANGCSHTVSKSEYVVGLSETSSLNYEVAPNPTHNWVEVKANSEIDHFKLLNAQGQILLYKDHMGSNTFHLDLSHYSEGVYLIQFEAEDHVESVRVVRY